jgi:hypothetical protein
MTERLSDHCDLMAQPGHPPPPKVRPADCPKDGVYIQTTDAGGHWLMHGDPPYPIVFEGGEGNDGVTIVGKTSNPVMMDGGKGDDSLTVIDSWDWALSRLGSHEITFLGATGIVLAALAAIGWKALSTKRRSRL